jgi:hypothetical protein
MFVKVAMVVMSNLSDFPMLENETLKFRCEFMKWLVMRYENDMTVEIDVDAELAEFRKKTGK